MLSKIPFLINLSDTEALTLEAAKEIIQNQNNISMIVIGVLGVFTFLLIAFFTAHWIWNYYHYKREFEESKKHLESSINTQLENTTNSFNNDMTTKYKEDLGNFTKAIQTDFEDMKKKTSKSLKDELKELVTHQIAVFSSLFCGQENYRSAAVFSSTAIFGYITLQKIELIRPLIETLIFSLEHCKYLDDYSREKIMLCTPHIPDILKPERDKIDDLIKRIPKKPDKF